jgi:hypothetical protein
MQQEPVILAPDHKVEVIVEVTLCAARNLPNVDGGGLMGIWGASCDAFVELACKDKTLKSTVKKNSLDPDWNPEEKFEFNLFSGELADIQIQLKDWNPTSSAKLLGTTVIGVNTLKQLMAGDKAAFPSDEFLITALITAPDGTPLMGKDQQQTHLVLKVAIVKEPYAEQPGGMMIAPDLTKVTPELEVSQQQQASSRANRRSPSHVPSPETRNPKATRANPLSGNWPPAFSRTAPSSGRTASLPQVSESKTSVGMQVNLHRRVHVECVLFAFTPANYKSSTPARIECMKAPFTHSSFINRCDLKPPSVCAGLIEQQPCAVFRHFSPISNGPQPPSAGRKEILKPYRTPWGPTHTRRRRGTAKRNHG